MVTPLDPVEVFPVLRRHPAVQASTDGLFAVRCPAGWSASECGLGPGVGGPGGGRMSTATRVVTAMIRERRIGIVLRFVCG